MYCNLSVVVPKIAQNSYLSQEPSHQIAENDGLVRFVVGIWGWDTSSSPQVSLPFVEPSVPSSGIDEEYPWGTLNEPSTIHQLNASFSHSVHCVQQRTWLRVDLLDFDSSLCSISKTKYVRTAVLTEALLRGPISV